MIVKYRELVQSKDKSKPFNMINKLYQVDAISAKEAPIAIKEQEGSSFASRKAN